MPSAPRQPTSEQAPSQEWAEFPVVGARARRWGRFERDLGAWLASPAGCFATWRARHALAQEPSAQSPR